MSVPPAPVTAVAAQPPSKPSPVVDTTVSLASPLLVNLLQTDGKDIQGMDQRPRPPAATKPRPRPLTKTLSQRVMTPRFPAVATAGQRFPPTTVSVATASTTTTTSSRAVRPALNSATSQPRSVLHGYSQFTGKLFTLNSFIQNSLFINVSALSSKPCSLTETKDASEEKNNTTDGKKLIINPLTGNCFKFFFLIPYESNLFGWNYFR